MMRIEFSNIQGLKKLIPFFFKDLFTLERGRRGRGGADSTLSIEPDAGLDLMTLSSQRPELKPRVRHSTN